MSWSEKFKVKQEITDSSYNQKVAGDTRMGPGKHEGAILAAVTPVEDWHAYDFVWENDKGETFKERIFVTRDIRDDSGRPTGERDISDGFVKLGLALAGGDNELNQQYFLESSSGAYINPERMKAAIGTKATLIIGLPKTGHTVKNTESGSIIVDIESGEQFGDTAFNDFADLKEYAQEMGIKLRYNQVKYHRVFKDGAEANREQIQSALEASKPKTKVAKAQGF